jgi:anti-sigma factor RsiW
VSESEITCKDLVELVTDYLDDRMPAEQRLRFEEHIAFCSPCAVYLEQMRQTISVTGALREEDLDQESRDAMLSVFKDFWR